MQQKKIMIDLVEDLFKHILKEYDCSPAYTAYTNSNDPHTVARIRLSNAPSWSNLGMGLDTTRGHTFTLYALTPDEGYGKEFYGGILEINGSFQGSNNLWMHPTDVIGPIGRVLHADKKTGKQIEMFRLNCMKKALELFYSGKYDDNPQIKIPEKKISIT